MYDGRLLAVATSTPSRVRARGAEAIDVPRTAWSGLTIRTGRKAASVSTQAGEVGHRLCCSAGNNQGRRILQLAPACTGPDRTTGPCTRTGAERARSGMPQGVGAAGLPAPCGSHEGVRL